jgi:hypothetical protein
MARSSKWCLQWRGHVWSCHLPRHTRSTVWHRAVESPSTVAVPGEWFTVLTLHCSHTVAAYLHALQTLTILHARTSCRFIMSLTSGSLKMCTCALGICVPSCTARPTRFFLCLRHVAHRETWNTWQHRSTSQLGGKVQSHRIRDRTRAHLSREVRSRATGHVAALEPTSVGKRGLEPQNTWQRWNPRQSGDEVWSHRIRGSTRAHLSQEARPGAYLSWEVRFRVIGHVATCGYTLCYLSWLKYFI